MNISGDLVSGNENIQQEFKKDFITRFSKEQIDQNLLSEYLNLIDKEVTDEENKEMTRTVTNSEIKGAIFEIGKDKSPGPDGFPACFFQEY